MKKNKLIALLISFFAINNAQSAVLDSNENDDFLTHVGRIAVFDYGTNGLHRRSVIRHVLGEKYVEFAQEIEPTSELSAAAMIAAYSQYLHDNKATNLRELLIKTLDASPNHYTRTLVGTNESRLQNVIEFDDKCSIASNSKLPYARTIDLRGNGGGSISCAIKVAETLINKGTKVEAKLSNNLSEEIVQMVGKNNTLVDKSKVVLVNQETASSAEFLAFALQDGGWDVRLEEGSDGTYGKSEVLVNLNYKGVKYTLTTGHFSVGECKSTHCRIRRQTAINHVSLSRQ